MEQTTDSLIAEYQATQDGYLHYDSFRWQSGSLLLAGVFVFWGFLITSPTTPESPQVVGLSGMLVWFLMSIWILFAHHYRQIYLCKIHRLWELEPILLMKQHIRFKDKKEYRTFGLKGHQLDMILYAVVCIGGSVLGIVKANTITVVLLAPILVTLVVLIWVSWNEYRIKRSLKNMDRK
jgi:hypothetical protein